MKPSDDDTMDLPEGDAVEVPGNVPGWIMLQQARLAAGVEIEPLAAVLKVSVRKLQALEAGKLNNPSEMTFTRALAASVCRRLRIEPGPVLNAWPGQSTDATAVPKTLSNDGTPNAATALPGSAQPSGGRSWLRGVGGLADRGWRLDGLPANAACQRTSSSQSNRATHGH